MELVFAEEEVVFYLPSERECFVMHGMGPYEAATVTFTNKKTRSCDVVFVFFGRECVHRLK